jgi:hypothetical protein
VVLVALYYLLPLDHDRNVAVTLIAGLLILLAVTAWQPRKVIHHQHPPVRAIEALAPPCRCSCCCLPGPISRWRPATRPASALAR